MPGNMINSRRSIHENRESITPQREESDQEDESVLKDSQDQISTENELEGDGVDTYSSIEDKRRAKFEISRSVPRTPQRPKLARIRGSPVPSYTPESLKQSPPKNEQKSGSFMYFLVLLVILTAVYFSWTNEPEIRYCSFDKLQKQYPQEKTSIWQKLKIGVELILNNLDQKPAVYLFTHRGSGNVGSLIKDIAIHSSGCFGKQLLPIEMEREDFIVTPGSNKDYGYAIEKYRAKIKNGNVILIANLNEIPAEAARALHTICDTHSPIAKHVVIFLTLTIAQNKKGSPDAIAEETLIELWGSKLGRNELDPLITRVTDQVIFLES